SAQGKPLPKLSGVFTQQGDRLELIVRTDQPPERVLAWSASSTTRDFRQARWRSHACRLSAGAYECEEHPTRDAYTALYSDAVFNDRGQPIFSLSTTVHISGGP